MNLIWWVGATLVWLSVWLALVMIGEARGSDRFLRVATVMLVATAVFWLAGIGVALMDAAS